MTSVDKYGHHNNLILMRLAAPFALLEILAQPLS